ncbi:hypothetical protein [Paenibacillus polymyxa]|uniref:hypothetical protein n=1 Tax=Paenibacillus TaxID=44249 RepID=UPI000F4FFBAD|nr:hypothetical protein [Paenibacillus polymyxa]RPE07793.1 hypothetical protein EG487_07935 [Paenibacillus polymyxa]
MVEKFEKTFVQLAQCELSPEERQAWWEENKVQLENTYPVAFFLNSNPSSTTFDGCLSLPAKREPSNIFRRETFHSKIPIYTNNTMELNSKPFRKIQKEQDKIQLDHLNKKIPQVFQTYLKFATSLRNVYSNSDVLDGGASLHKIEQVEASLDFQLPSDVKKAF